MNQVCLFSCSFVISGSLCKPGTILKNPDQEIKVFSSFQVHLVICDVIRLPIGAIRAHIKPLKPVILLRNPRKSGFLKNRQPNSRFLALNSPMMRSSTACFTDRGLYRADFPNYFSYPLASPPDPQKQYPAYQGFFDL
jgi:hypothetical protein